MKKKKTNLICNQINEISSDFALVSQNQHRVLGVVILTFTMMIIEIFIGYQSGSMALLADGYHMASHAGALALAYFVYRLSRNATLASKLNFGTGKLLALGGYTSAIILAIIAFLMVIEAIERFLHPISINFNEALFVATLGLIVNLASIFILKSDHHHHHHHHHHHKHDHNHQSDHHHQKAPRILNHTLKHDQLRPNPESKKNTNIRDHNHQSALMHIIADAVTSLAAIFALIFGKYYQLSWLDPLVGAVGSVVILQWAYKLCRETSWELLDGHPEEFSIADIKESMERDGHKVWDLHAWHTGPSNIVCILTVSPKSKTEFSQEMFRKYFDGLSQGLHLVVETRS